MAESLGAELCNSGKSRLILRSPLESELGTFSLFARAQILAFKYLPDLACEMEAQKYTVSNCRMALADPNTVIVAAYLNGKELVGFVHMSAHAEIGWVHWIAITLAARKHNIAWYLWRKCFSEARKRGVRKLWGNIVADNNESRKMALKIGFEEIAPLPNFWHGLDHVLVVKSLGRRLEYFKN